MGEGGRHEFGFDLGEQTLNAKGAGLQMSPMGHTLIRMRPTGTFVGANVVIAAAANDGRLG
jgi:hypothetical protein